jgi:hypothetical protein
MCCTSFHLFGMVIVNVAGVVVVIEVEMRFMLELEEVDLDLVESVGCM